MDAGIGPDFMTVYGFHEQSLDGGITQPKQPFSSKTKTNLSVPSGAVSFQFSTPVAFGGSYNVTVFQQPIGLTCTVNNGSGTNVTSDVTNIGITCSTISFTISGSISGLIASGLILQNNGGDNLSVASNSTFSNLNPAAFVKL